MPMSSFLRERAQAYADNVVATLLLVGGSAVTGWLINHYGTVLGLDQRAALVLAWVIALLIAMTLSLLLKPKQQTRESQSPSRKQHLSQTGIVDRTHFEFKPHNEFKPSVVVNVPSHELHAHTQPQIMGRIQSAKDFRMPDLEFTNPIIIDRWLDLEHGLTEEEDEDSGSLKVKVVLARFYYKPDQGVPPRISVKAHISIANSAGVPIKARFDAVWEEEEDEYKEFDTADTHALVIAMIPCDDAIATLQHGSRPYPDTQYGRYFAPSSETLEGKEFRLRVDLIGKRYDEVVINKPFNFNLNLDPPLMKLI